LGINFDVALFTNLSHAHIEAHGSFGNYQEAKAKLFKVLQNSRKKSFFPEKIIGVNLDDPMSGYFLSFAADKKFGVTFKGIRARSAQKIFEAVLVKAVPPLEFSIGQTPFVLNMPGEFNAQNASLASACASMLGVGLPVAAQALKNFVGVRGRMEGVPNNLGFNIIVDFGCEPVSIKAALEAAAQLPHGRLIHIFGSTGGHRDAGKRFIFGKTSAQYADYIIITNDDIYGSDQQEIANNIEQGIKSFKLRQPPYETVLDRRSAIARALFIAQIGDIILITGKGSEQFLVLPGNKRIEWDEVEVVKEELQKIK
jgi:UDP-N-acetylmuramyl-tripeptide synthetase